MIYFQTQAQQRLRAYLQLQRDDGAGRGHRGPYWINPTSATGGTQPARSNSPNSPSIESRGELKRQNLTISGPGLNKITQDLMAGQQDPESSENVLKIICAVVKAVTQGTISPPTHQFKNWHWDARRPSNWHDSVETRALLRPCPDMEGGTGSPTLPWRQEDAC